ncbi:MAG: CoA transferase [Proteobacteria bacterium]|nr:CoA transferase [Pseudomonadota bacterium]
MLLQGIRVVEMGVWVAGPAVAGVLADWGADVVKIEAPSGDPMRAFAKAIAGIDLPSSPPFNVDNRGKRGVVIDTRTDQGRALARKLVLGADVFLTNFRPDALARMGLDYESLAADNPRLIYAHVTGYGLEGPDKDRAGYDIGSFWARSGIAQLLAPPDGDPVGSRGGFGDHITAITAVGGIAGALFHRERTGEGQRVDVSLLGCAIYALGWDLQQQIEFGTVMSAGRREESIAPTVTHFKAGDGRWVWLLGVETERHWPRLCKGLDREDLLDDERFASAPARRENARELMTILDARFAERPLDEWLARFDEVDLWWAPVQTPAEVVEDPQALAAGAFTEMPAADGGPGRKVVASPVRFEKVDTNPKAGPPGLAADEIKRLRDAGVLG